MRFLFAILSWASFFGASVVYKNVPLPLRVLPATGGVEIEERIALDGSVIEKSLSKISDQVVGHPTYPSQLAHLVFELAFLEAEEMRLTSKERTT